MGKEIFTLKLTQTEASELLIAVRARMANPEPDSETCGLCKKYKPKRPKSVFCMADRCPAHKAVEIVYQAALPEGYSSGEVSYETSVCLRYAALHKEVGKVRALEFLAEVERQLLERLATRNGYETRPHS